MTQSPRASGGRVPPHNLDAEQSLLGAMLLSRDAIAAAVEACGSDDFYKPAHGHIFDAITALYGQGEPADPVTVADELNRAGLLDAVGGLSTLVSLQADTPATANAGRYATIVEEHALLRRLIGVAGEIAELGYSTPEDVEAVVDEAESLVFEVAERRTTDTLKPLNKLLGDSLDRLAALYERGEAVTGIPTGYVDIDERLSGLQKSALVIVGARPAMGKCLAWDSRIPDPVSGALTTIEELHRRMTSGRMTSGEPGRGVEVLTLDEDRTLRPAAASRSIDDGVKHVWRVRTRLGREVRTTASHPFLTPGGWRPLAELGVGAAVAVPGVLRTGASERMDPSELVLLAYLLSGSTSIGTEVRTTVSSPVVLADLTTAATTLGVRVVAPADSDREPPGTPLTYRLTATDDGARPLLALLRRHGLDGRRAQDRRVPDAVFRLAPPDVARFLSRVFATDGATSWHDGTGRYGRITYTCASRGLARDVQHLLLRFGINARLRLDPVAVRTGRVLAWELELVTGEDIERFCEEIGIFSMWATCNRFLARARAGRVTARRTQGSGGAGTSPSLGAALAVLDDGALPPPDDVVWDEVVAIVADGEDRVYDLTVPGTHNFVAEDVVVHNTAFALGIAAHAAMESGEPVLIFSLEMSHSEITQRLLVSEARVDATRIRNGKLIESDWPKISNAIGRLGDAPIFVDDNPRLTVMELRAKARRLKAREGALGLIVVDYLQLMSGRHSAENRQVEISEISRGLKVLARELEVPVVALSQLSRNLEMRADKRPILADLRESGSLEQDADVVMFLYRDEMYNPDSPDRGTAEVIVSKHRNGPTGKATLAFLDHYTRFANMARV